MTGAEIGAHLDDCSDLTGGVSQDKKNIYLSSVTNYAISLVHCETIKKNLLIH